MILSFVFLYQPNEVDLEDTNLSLSETENVLFFGTGSGLTELDPHNIWDRGSENVVSQVVEGLFKHDLSDPDLAVVPNLAAGHGTWIGNRYTVDLVPNIYFHDGTPFNAQAVKFSFDRLAYMIDSGYAVAADLYRYYDHETDQMKPIINNVEAISEYVVEFELDVPYGLFESLLCFVGSSILSLDPDSTPPWTLIDTYTGTLVGTGPFTFEYYDPDVEVSLRANENYRYGKPDIDHLVFKFISDSSERADALLNNELHMIQGVSSDYIDTFNSDPNYVVDSKDSTIVYYYGMNNYWINKDVREAISYAIDYDYIIDELLGGQASRLRSPIPEGIMYSSNTHNVAETNIIHARTVMQILGHGVGLDLYDDAGWESSSFLSFNFTFILGSMISENSFYIFQDNLSKIGIEVTGAGLGYGQFLDRYSETPGFHREMLQLFWLGWGADYNDASNFINNLFTNRIVASNGVNYNGFQAAIEAGRDPFNLWDNVQLLMEAALFETDVIIREQYYYRIQQILVEEDRPWAFGYVPIASVAYQSEIQGFQWNAMQEVRFFGVTGVPYEIPEPEPPTILIVGSHRGLAALEPLDAWDYGSFDVIDQVAEGLFWYDLSDPDCAIIPKLAVDHGTWDGNLYTVDLRQNVEFHDGTHFNASAVEFTFDRLQYFLDNDMLYASTLYEYYDPETDQMKPIINDVEILSEYSVRFHLAIPYGPFEALLAFESSFILSPESHELEEYIDINTDTLVGTGPFVYEYYDPGVEVSFSAFENYWDGEPSIDFLKFRYDYDQNERADLLASGDIHMILSPPTDRRGEFEGNPDFTLDSIESVTEYYLGMNNYWINRDLREAISYAIDYDYMINELTDYDASRLKSPVPNGILYSDDSFNVPTMNIAQARTMMQSMGHGLGWDVTPGSEDDILWEAATFYSLNYTYNIGNQFREDLFYLLEDNLDKIGIEVLDAGMDWLSYYFRLIEQDGLHRERLQLFSMGWVADYNDPSNFINNLFTNRSIAFNTVNYNGFEAAIEAGRDPFDLLDNVQLLMEAAILEIDPIIREQYYYRIQQLLVEEDMPWAYGFVPIREVWYNSMIQGFQWNALEKLDFREVSGVLYEEPEPEPPTILILGSSRVLQGIDPLDVWDAGSWDVIDQVAEGLFGYDHSHPDNIVVPKLAVDYGTWDGNLYTVELEQNVVFHDGTPFNASAVEFTFDRLQYFKDNGMLMTSGLYEYYDHETDQMIPIINDVEALSEYEVVFHLNIPYGPFESLLAFESSFILSPESHEIEEYIDINTDTLVGTGPFVYEYYDPGVEVSFSAFENYWDGEPSIAFLQFRYIEDANERADLLASGEIHMILDPPTDRRGEFEGNPDFTLDSVDGANEGYLGMSNYWINRDLREAISYAINYDYMISDLTEYDLSRLKSPIPNGILYSVESFDVATYNLMHARTIMQSMGYGVGWDVTPGSPDDILWEAATFLSLNYSYNIGNPIRESFYPLLVDNLAKIGIEVLDGGMSWPEYLGRLGEGNDLHRNMLQLFLIGWWADYNDPSNFIDGSFTNRTSAFNTVNYDGFDAAVEAGRDPFYLWDNVQLLMEAAMFETDQILRAQYFARIQQLLVEEDMPWAYAYVHIHEVWYDSEIQGFQWNALEKLNFVGVSGISDNTPPESNAWEEGILNLNQEYYGDVTINIDAWDDISGVFATYYSFDNIEWYTGDTFVISDLGTTDYYYYSVDNSGNEETVKTGSVTITSRPEDDRTVILGLGYDPFEIDPLRAWDTTTYAIIDQVAEGLFAYDLSDPQMAIIPRLAMGYGIWSPDGLSYTVNLRTDVFFHDGEHFDARAVKWTFDRMIYFMELGLGYNDDVYRFTDGTPIISSVDILHFYMVQFNLNRPFAGLEALLSFTGSAILSPGSTPATAFLDPSVDALVGTGPFKLDRYVQDVGVGFVAFQDYYNGEANIKDLWYLFIGDTMLRTEALLNGYIDFLENPEYSMLNQFENTPDFTVLNTPGALVSFININNQKINMIFRQAIAHAFDYDFVISMYNDAVRAQSIIAEGLLYSDWSSDNPTFDIVAARQILLDNGIAELNPYDDTAWTDLVDFGTPIATFNFTYNIGNMVREQISHMLKDNLRLIGIELVEVPVYWGEFIQLLIEYPERLELFNLAWIPDYNDPYAMVNLLLSNDAFYNFGFVDDPYLQSLMDQGVAELDPVARQSIYNELQRYFMEQLVPMLPIYNPMIYFIHDSTFMGFNLNALNKVWFYSVSTFPPVWLQEPTDQIIELGDHLYYQVFAWDRSGIDHYWVSDTENFAVDSNGVITTNTLLEVGVYELEIRAYDPYDNHCSATIQVTVQDTTAPFYGPVYDTLPAETIIIYTRSTQVIGSLLVSDRSEIALVVLQHNNPSGGPDGFIVETYPQQEAFANIIVEFTNIIVKTTSSLEIGRHELSLYIYDIYGNELRKDFAVIVYRQFDLEFSGELDYLEKEDVRISFSAYLTDAETGEYIDPSDYAGLNLVVGFDLYDNDGNLVKAGLLTYVGSGLWRWVDVETIGNQKNLLTKGVYMVDGWVEVDHDYILKDRDVIQIHIDPPPDEVDPMAILTIISFSGLIALIAVQSIFYIRKRKRKS